MDSEHHSIKSLGSFAFISSRFINIFPYFIGFKNPKEACKKVLVIILIKRQVKNSGWHFYNYEDKPVTFGLEY